LRVRSALITVPPTKPRVTAIDSQAWALVDIQAVRRTGTTAVAENHRDSAPSSARQIHASIRQRMQRTLGRSASHCQGAAPPETGWNGDARRAGPGCLAQRTATER